MVSINHRGPRDRVRITQGLESGCAGRQVSFELPRNLKRCLSPKILRFAVLVREAMSQLSFELIGMLERRMMIQLFECSELCFCLKLQTRFKFFPLTPNKITILSINTIHNLKRNFLPRPLRATYITLDPRQRVEPAGNNGGKVNRRSLNVIKSRSN